MFLEDDLAKASDQNQFVRQVREYVGHHHDTGAVVVSAEIESELVMLSPEEQAEYLAGLGVAETGVGNLIREASAILLGLRTYLTTGRGRKRHEHGPFMPASRLAQAGVIHCDLEGLVR